jgi:hypothetical protein
MPGRAQFGADDRSQNAAANGRVDFFVEMEKDLKGVFCQEIFFGHDADLLEFFSELGANIW